MLNHKSLLIELGTEELPPKALPELAQAFFEGILAGLKKREITFDPQGARCLYSPRRLAVFVPHVASEQSTQSSEVFGPYLNIGLNADGQPTPALLGFAAKNGLTIEQLGKITDNKGERFLARSEKMGAKTTALLPEIVNEALKALPIPKPMRWGTREISFVRPVHWLVMLFGEQVVEGEVLGLKADRMSRGHRFHHSKPVRIGKPEDYIDALRAAFVLVDPQERMAQVRAEISAAAVLADGVARVPEALIEEVNCLVEWPRAILCGFDRTFLRVPEEALILTMESNQKFFPVLNGKHRLTARFIGIANIESSDPAEIRKGYERVIRPRFADAQFFFDEDLKQGLDSMRQGLASVTYQQKLGSYADKSERVAQLAKAIAEQIGADADNARRAAELSKADLQSRMVGEFPELQGIMGRYYASAMGERGEVADAINHAYMPRFAGDAIAPSTLGQVLAIAERLDTLAGGFAAGLKPTGSKDPFALRRHALGLARTLIEAQIDIDIQQFVDHALKAVRTDMARLNTWQRDPKQDAPTLEDIFLDHEINDFILDRLRGYYLDQGFTNAQFDAIAMLGAPVAVATAPTNNAYEASVGAVATATGVTSLLDFDSRLKAIGEFVKLPEAEALAAANKRIRNILKKTDDAISARINPVLWSESSERTLYAAVESAIADTGPLLASRDYVGVLKRLAALRVPVDDFFDNVMVMAEDAAVRGNRLALLKRLADRFATVAAVELLSAN